MSWLQKQVRKYRKKPWKLVKWTVGLAATLATGWVPLLGGIPLGICAAAWAYLKIDTPRRKRLQ